MVEILARRFIQRWDMYPKQLDDGTYITVHEPLNVGLLFDHLRGDITLGTYLLDKESKGRFLVLDADDAPGWRRLEALTRVLAEAGSTSYLEQSRRGGHLWFYFPKPLPGADIRAFGKGLLSYFKIEGIELYPRQDNVTDGVGSLIRLPFGIHRKSGQRYDFYLPNGEPVAPSLFEQIHVFEAPETIPEGVVNRFTAYVPPPVATPPSRSFEEARDAILIVDRDAPVAERIKAAASIRQFVLRYVELSPSGRGLCPFHDDHHPSFSVNDKGNYWHCFACDEGGSIIDFWMKWQQCDFKTAVAELAKMLL
jgi:hypothetical protein